MPILLGSDRNRPCHMKKAHTADINNDGRPDLFWATYCETKTLSCEAPQKNGGKTEMVCRVEVEPEETFQVSVGSIEGPQPLAVRSDSTKDLYVFVADQETGIDAATSPKGPRFAPGDRVILADGSSDKIDHLIFKIDRNFRVQGIFASFATRTGHKDVPLTEIKKTK